jgi:hypothetical protein
MSPLCSNATLSSLEDNQSVTCQEQQEDNPLRLKRHHAWKSDIATQLVEQLAGGDAMDLPPVS